MPAHARSSPATSTDQTAVKAIEIEIETLIGTPNHAAQCAERLVRSVPPGIVFITEPVARGSAYPSLGSHSCLPLPGQPLRRGGLLLTAAPIVPSRFVTMGLRA
jgi:hypothetical protein